MSISINTSIICLSLAYLNRNYSSVSKVSKWIFNKLSEIKYNDDKLLRSLNNKDILIIENIIQFVKDKSIVEKYLFKYCIKYIRTDESWCRFVTIPKDKKYFLDIIKLVIGKNIIDIHYKEDFLLRHASFFENVDAVIFLINNGANVHAKYNESLRVASVVGNYDVVKLLIDNGVDIHVQNDFPLKAACDKSHYVIVKLLIDKMLTNKLNNFI